MSAPSQAEPGSTGDAQGTSSPAVSATRPIYWSVKRELWQFRWVTIVPLVVAGVVLVGFLISAVTLPERMRSLSALEPARQHAAIAMPYSVAAVLMVVTAFILGAIYCLETLQSEGRDRSILFWKSLPVSDLATVLSKASIPLVVLPLLVFAVTVTTQLIMLLMSTLVLLGQHPGVAMLWDRLSLFEMSLALLYALASITLWHAPIYSWLLLVSSWARRATLLWALLPFLALAGFERVAFGTSHVASILKHRLTGWFPPAFVFDTQDGAAIEPLAQLTPARFLSTPGLWIGLVFAAVFLAATVRLRRRREPM